MNVHSNDEITGGSERSDSTNLCALAARLGAKGAAARLHVSAPVVYAAQKDGTCRASFEELARMALEEIERVEEKLAEGVPTIFVVKVPADKLSAFTAI